MRQTFLALAALLAATPARAGTDLPGIRATKVLRVLVPGTGEDFLPRQGMPASSDRELALELGQKLGVEIEFVVTSGYDNLIPALLEGRGDLIAAQLTVTDARKQKVAFTRPTLLVQEVLVGKKGGEGLPHKASELAGREVHVRASSAYAETLAKLAAKEAKGVTVVAAPETLDTEQIVYEVGRGQRPLTVVDSHILKAIEAYNPDVERLAVLAEKRPIAWAVRKDSPQLKVAVDAFLAQRALTKHLQERFTGDLAGIKERRVLRVLTRNNAVSYFLYRGDQFGFDYDLAKMVAKELGVRLEMVVVPSRDLLIPWLLEGRGDVIAASFSRTPEREKQVAFSKAYQIVDEHLARKKGTYPELTKVEDLKGREVHVRKSSGYYETLAALQKTMPDLKIVEEPEEQETEEILQKLAEGVIPLTVADTHFLDVEKVYGAPIEGVFPIASKREIAFAVRPGSKKLLEALDAFVKKTYKGVEYNMARKKYFENTRQIGIAHEQQAARAGTISPYDKLIRQYAAQYGFDWRLLAAQAYAESRFDPEAKSWVGAVGLFQVMPTTGAELGFANLHDPEQGVHAGIKYVDQIMHRLDPDLDLKQRIRFSLAAYNVGIGHVLDARRIAREKGLDPNRWFGNVEQAMLLLEKPEYAKQAKSGFCRGSEPVAYVSKIQTHYDAYVTAVAP